MSLIDTFKKKNKEPEEIFDLINCEIDGDKYPTDGFLIQIQNYPMGAGYFHMMSSICDAWSIMPTARWEIAASPISGIEMDINGNVEALKYTIATGGWSGAESIISALKDNTMFWRNCWYMSRRGGLFEFEVRNSLGNYNKDLYRNTKDLR